MLGRRGKIKSLKHEDEQVSVMVTNLYSTIERLKHQLEHAARYDLMVVRSIYRVSIMTSFAISSMKSKQKH
jgi:hypothetical protein